VAAADVATVTPSVTSTARAGASAACTASLMGCLATGTPAPAPGAVSFAASTALGEGGAGSHLSGRAHPPSLSSSLLSDDEYSEVVREESPCCSCSRNSLPGAPVAGSSSPSYASPTPVPAAAPRARSRSRRGRVRNERKIRPR
jgi:hypothetical protein